MLYETERENEAETSNARIRRQDEQQFFKRGASQAQADLAHWSKAAYWKLDEAVALTFGWEPEAVIWRAIESRVQISARAKECAKVRTWFIEHRSVCNCQRRCHQVGF